MSAFSASVFSFVYMQSHFCENPVAPSGFLRSVFVDYINWPFSTILWKDVQHEIFVGFLWNYWWARNSLSTQCGLNKLPVFVVVVRCIVWSVNVAVTTTCTWRDQWSRPVVGFVVMSPCRWKLHQVDFTWEHRAACSSEHQSTTSYCHRLHPPGRHRHSMVDVTSGRWMPPNVSQCRVVQSRRPVPSTSASLSLTRRWASSATSTLTAVQCACVISTLRGQTSAQFCRCGRTVHCVWTNRFAVHVHSVPSSTDVMLDSRGYSTKMRLTSPAFVIPFMIRSGCPLCVLCHRLIQGIPWLQWRHYRRMSFSCWEFNCQRCICHARRRKSAPLGITRPIWTSVISWNSLVSSSLIPVTAFVRGSGACAAQIVYCTT